MEYNNKFGGLDCNNMENLMLIAILKNLVVGIGLPMIAYFMLKREI